MKNIFLVLLIVSGGMYAQIPNKGSNYEKIKALKTAHITQELDLTSAEAEKFWPIFNAFDANIMMLRKEERTAIKSKLKNGGIDALSVEEANAIIDKMLEMRTTELNYRKQLVTDLRNVISPNKIIKLKRAEESFKRMLLERLKQRKGKR